MKKKSLFAITLLSCLFFAPGPGEGSISEKQLKKNNARMLQVFTRDNPRQREAIGRLIRLYIGEKSSGARLIDRFGIFLQDCRNNKIDIMRTWFFRDSDSFTIFLKTKDRQDDQLYLMFMHFNYDLRKGACTLRDISFGPHFEEKKRVFERLFNNGGEVEDYREEKPLDNAGDSPQNRKEDSSSGNGP